MVCVRSPGREEYPEYVPGVLRINLAFPTSPLLGRLPVSLALASLLEPTSQGQTTATVVTPEGVLATCTVELHGFSWTRGSTHGERRLLQGRQEIDEDRLGGGIRPRRQAEDGDVLVPGFLELPSLELLGRPVQGPDVVQPVAHLHQDGPVVGRLEPSHVVVIGLGQEPNPSSHVRPEELLDDVGIDVLGILQGIVEDCRADEVRVVDLCLVHQDQGHPTNVLEVPKGIPVFPEFLADLSPMPELGEVVGPTNPHQVRRCQPGFQSGKEAGLVLHRHLLHRSFT